MFFRSIPVCVVVLFACVASHAPAQTAITSIQPRTCAPGKTTRLVIAGKDLDASLKFIANSPQVAIAVNSIEATQAAVDVTLPSDMPLGPFGLWIAAANGPVKQQILLSDDLASLADNGNNHTPETAQAVPNLCTVEGSCDGSVSDFYKISVAAGQRVALEVHSQALQSAMDPVVRVLAAANSTLHLADDSAVGPDVRFSYTFEAAGDYLIEVHDSRHAAAGGVYQLRIGDFPIVSHSYPLAVQIGTSTQLSFGGVDGELAVPQEVQLPADALGSSYISAKSADSASSSWVSLGSSMHPQQVESEAIKSAEPLQLPIGISGQLLQPQETDTYRLQGTKGQTVRVASRTRSVGCPTLLQMQLFNAAGAKVAETKVADTDEWSFDFAFPEDGEYRLDVSDLLHRGGAEFGYWVELAPAPAIAVAIKADAAVREEFAVELAQGATAVDLQIARFGYDGPIDISLASPVSGLRLLNSRLAAAAKDGRVYLAVDENWTGDRHALIRLKATATDAAGVSCVVDSRGLHRIKTPFVLAPPLWNDGTLFVAAAAPTETPFALKSAAAVRFARPVRTHTASLTLQRIQEAFKANVDVLGEALPAGWTTTVAIDKEAYTATLTNSGELSSHPEALPLRIFGELNGRGRIETYEMPIEWFDPLKVTLELAAPAVRGGKAQVVAHVVREGAEPQPVTLTFANLPSGVTAPESISIAADQTQVAFELQLAADVATSSDVQLIANAASKFAGQDFSVSSAATSLKILESPEQLSVFPTAIEIADPRGQQQVIVTGLDALSAPRDWTRFARLTSANPAVAEVRGSVIYPKSDGETELVVEVGGAKQVLPIRVSNATAERPIGFESEALVALSKQGCNSGACHGSPSGKGGFRLSLRAFDMQLDELTLIREDFGRRVNTLDPEQSLMLLKPLMKVQHGGGKQLHTSDPAYKILRDWIAGGALADAADTPRVVRLELYPNKKQVLALADGGQQLAVTAHFADGSRRDVTELVAYETSDTSVATVDEAGLVTPHARGEIAILVRFLEHIESLPLMFVDSQEGFEWQSPPPSNYVDELVNSKLKQLEYLPAETCSDAEFMRRVSLDVIGILPSVDEAKAFLADSGADKRARLIDALLDRDEYPKFWALKWGDLLKLTSKLVGDEGVYKYHRWIEEALRDNLPYDEFARQLLTGSGSTLANPPANFYRTATDMNECVETISQVFLGARLQCAKCHNHPFERWTQDNYYGLGAFFNRVERRKTERPGEMFVFTSNSGDVTQPRTGQIMAPWLPQVGSIDPENDTDRRIAFVDWLVEPSNPYFARIEANRIWSQLFARGIVDPIDDFRDSNPPANAPLLDALAQDFADSGYDRKHLLRTILNSRTYQASYRTNAFNQDDVTYFSHQEPRLLAAEQLLDAINQTLGLEQSFGNLPAGTRATQLPAPDVVKVDFLKVFGQPERSTVCACERSDDSNLGMAIELFNGPMIHEKLRDEKNRFRTSLAAGHSVEETIHELYLAAVSRTPSDIELQAAMDHCAKSESPAAGLEDVCWALFNTDEFLFQH